MKIAVAIPNHNQGPMVLDAIGSLLSQSVRPSHIFVMSDDTPMDLGAFVHPPVITINNPKGCGGRCGNRNSVIFPFLDSDADALIFIDGDCQAKDSTFIEDYARLLDMHDLVFACREHTSIDGISRPASDLLTANMDRLWAGGPLDYTDLRVASGAVSAWQDARTFNERLDLMLTGMIGWSCNFGITRNGLERLLDFMDAAHGREGELFDSEAFGHGWGYEDVAMGIDAMYAGLDVWISESPLVMHQSHERSDGLFDHVRGRHMIMDRYRDLQDLMTFKNRVTTGAIVAAISFIAGALAVIL